MSRLSVITFALAFLVISPGCPDDYESEDWPIELWEEVWSADRFTGISDAQSNGDHAWMVGNRGGEARLFYRANGDWRPLTFPMEANSLRAVHVFDDGSIVTVGDGGLAATGNVGAWRLLEAPEGQDLVDVWGSSHDNFWAVSRGSDSELLHFDGLDWTTIDFWSYGVSQTRPRAVSGTGPSDVWVVGDEGRVLRWDGEVFTPIYPGIEGDLSAVLARDKDVFVGGEAMAVLSRDDGEWTAIDASASDIDAVGGDLWLIGQPYDGFGPLENDGFPREWRYEQEYDSRKIAATDVMKLPDGGIACVAGRTMFRRLEPTD